MENRKCQTCKQREKDGFCVMVKAFVPRKSTVNGVNRAPECVHYTTKREN